MTRKIAVVGSTGQQGGAVVHALLQASGWKVRGITRNISSQKAKELAAQGVDMVAGDIDDIKSLISAFKAIKPTSQCTAGD